MRWLLAIAALPAIGSAQAGPLEYDHDGTTLEGYVALPDTPGPHPGVIVVHDWDGLDDYERMRADMLAELGYVALAIDVYGQGVRPTNQAESAAQAQLYYGDPQLFRARIQAGLQALKSLDSVDSDRTAAMGYCFGGAGVLELARDGADTLGVVSFHGSLGAMAESAGDLPKLLVLHASQDPVVPQDEFVGFLEEMTAAGADYQIVVYNLRAHAFTKVGGPQYDADADRRSWQAMKGFLAELFGD